MKKILVILLIYTSMGFAVVHECDPPKKVVETGQTLKRPGVYIEIASPKASPITVYSSGNQ